MKKVWVKMVSLGIAGIMLLSSTGCEFFDKFKSSETDSSTLQASEKADVELAEGLDGEGLDDTAKSVQTGYDSSKGGTTLSDEELLLAEQMNSYSMMYYLAITAEKIRISKDNRLLLDDIYNSLLNDVNPSAVDEETQNHINQLLKSIEDFNTLADKRERLEYIHNQQKALAMQEASSDVEEDFSLVDLIDWKELAVDTTSTIVESISTYKETQDNIEMNYLFSGWDLDDQEKEIILQNRKDAYNYMITMVRTYNLDGKLTLNEEAFEDFAEICATSNTSEKIRKLESEEDRYKLLGDYWLELADSYFELDQYGKCLNCVENYKKLSTGIYRQDYNLAQVLPKAIVSARNVYSDSEYVKVAEEYADEILSNTDKKDWSDRYFVSRVYVDLYNRTGNKKYLDDAYDITFDNVAFLMDEQREYNDTYVQEIQEIELEEPDYEELKESIQKIKKLEFKEEKKNLAKYIKFLKSLRKTELPSLYEPLILNCELLQALAGEMNLDQKEKDNVASIISDGIPALPVCDHYSFNDQEEYEGIVVKDNSIEIPVKLLSAGAKVSVVLSEPDSQGTEINDITVKNVQRKGKKIEDFKAIVSSSAYRKYKWTDKTKLTITITYGDAYGKSISSDFKVTNYKKTGPFTKIEFGED